MKIETRPGRVLIVLSIPEAIGIAAVHSATGTVKLFKNPAEVAAFDEAIREQPRLEQRAESYITKEEWFAERRSIAVDAERLTERVDALEDVLYLLREDGVIPQGKEPGVDVEVNTANETDQP